MKTKMIAISGFGRGWWFKSISSKMHPSVSFWIGFSVRKNPREESVKGWYKLRVGENMYEVRSFIISDDIGIIVSNAKSLYDLSTQGIDEYWNLTMNRSSLITLILIVARL